MKRRLAILLACVLTVQGIVPAAAEETAADAEAAGPIAVKLAEETAAETEDAAKELLAGKLMDEAGQDVPAYEELDAEAVQNEIAAPETDAAVMTEAVTDAATGAESETAVKPVNESDAEQTEEQEAETSADGAEELIIEPDYADVELAETALPETSVIAAGDVPIDAAHFPDERFREYVKQFDQNEDSILSKSEIQKVDTIYCYSYGISDFSGIEYFTALTGLNCSHNTLKSLDVSKNKALTFLICYGDDSSGLTSLDVSNNTALTVLACARNRLSSLDLSKNTALIQLDCAGNQLISLDVSKSIALTELTCEYNQLTNLDVSKNIALKKLNCDNNQLTNLDVSKNTALTELYCAENQLKSLDVSKNTQLLYIGCGDNQLKSLDVSKNTRLYDLYCENNQLMSLNLSKNMKLWVLHCKSNQLMNLDLSKNINLEKLFCSGNTGKIVLASIKGGWQLDLERVAGAGNAGRVTITSKIAGMTRKGNIISFVGDAPKTLTYTYDTGASGLAEDSEDKILEVTLTLSTEACTKHKFGEYVVTRQATALKKGTAVRTCTVCGEQQSKSVPKLKPTIKLSTSSVTLDVKKSVKVKVSALASGDAVASWKSSDTSIATVNKKGKITAKSKAGKATVTVTLKSGLSKKISVTVQKGAVACTSVTLNKKSLTLKKGKTFTLKATVKPASCTQKAAYKTSSKSVATVNSKGKITAKKKGTATITVTVGKKTATCKVKVVK